MKSVNSTKLPKMDRSLRLSSKPEEQMTSSKIKTILDNNRFFPHLYDPYYDRKDVKKGLLRVLDAERRGKSLDKMIRWVRKGCKLVNRLGRYLHRRLLSIRIRLKLHL